MDAVGFSSFQNVIHGQTCVTRLGDDIQNGFFNAPCARTRGLNRFANIGIESRRVHAPKREGFDKAGALASKLRHLRINLGYALADSRLLFFHPTHLGSSEALVTPEGLEPLR